MKYLIVGLGNIGPQYELTRHNIGFLILDYLASKFESTFKSERLGDYSLIKFKSTKSLMSNVLIPNSCKSCEFILKYLYMI